MKKIILTLSGIVLVLVVYAQSRETRNLSSFNEISVSEAIKVELVKGSSEKAGVSRKLITTAMKAMINKAGQLNT